LVLNNLFFSFGIKVFTSPTLLFVISLFMEGEKMPTSYEIVKAIGLVIFKCSGAANAQEVIELFNRLQTDPDFSFSYDFLWDARGRTVPWTAEETRKVASYMRSFKINKEPKPKRAFLYSKDVDYGMGRVYEGYRAGRSDVDMEIFKNRNEALKWLGVHDNPMFRSGRYSE